MKMTITIELEHVDGTGRDDPERVAEMIYYRAIGEGYTVDAGRRGEARYTVKGYTLDNEDPEYDDETGEPVDVLPED